MAPGADRQPVDAGWLAKAAFAAIAWPAVVRASLRAAWWLRKLPLDQAVERLREVPTTLKPFRSRPRWLAGVADRLLPVLPPYGHGPCLKRSLLLLDLWSRCGLEPTFHLGMQHRSRPGESRPVDLHAWVTAGPLSTPSEHDEIWCR